jgi:hypothetical protein
MNKSSDQLLSEKSIKRVASFEPKEPMTDIQNNHELIVCIIKSFFSSTFSI